MFECKQSCIEDLENNNCSEQDCYDRCDNCMNLNCKWNITDYRSQMSLKPSKPSIKCFSGNKSLKVTWVKPFSKSDIDSYYIIVSNSFTGNLNTYTYKSAAELNEYIVNNLSNNIVYDVIVIAKNRYGVSESSNTESVILSENKSFGEVSDVDLSAYEDSIGDYYRDQSSDSGIRNDSTLDVQQSISNIERLMIVNDLKESLTDKMIGDRTINQYNINIY